MTNAASRNPKTFRIFSPDELISNKLDAVLRDSGRNFQWDIASRAQGGRVIEILSEHTCQGMLQGYTLTGRTGLFPSYEAFLGIIHTMMVQYSKFVKMVSPMNTLQTHILILPPPPPSGSRDDVASIIRLAELRRDFDVDTPGTQRFLPPKPFFHWCCPKPQADACSCLSATRCQLLPEHRCALLARQGLYQPYGW